MIVLTELLHMYAARLSFCIVYFTSFALNNFADDHEP